MEFIIVYIITYINNNICNKSDSLMGGGRTNRAVDTTISERDSFLQKRSLAREWVYVAHKCAT